MAKKRKRVPDVLPLREDALSAAQSHQPDSQMPRVPSTPSSEKPTLVIFRAQDDEADGWKLAERLVKEMPEFDPVLVNRLSSTKENLRLVVQHRVMTSPCVIAVRGDVEVLRHYGNISASRLREHLEKL